MAKYLLFNEQIILNRHKYRIISIKKGIGIQTVRVESVRFGNDRSVVFTDSEFVKVVEGQ